MSTPNILFLHCHDLGRYLGCYDRALSTPHLDALAAQGGTFTNAFCTSPACSPSRGSIMTGRLPHANGLVGLVNQGWRLNPGEVTLPRLLAENGYTTHLFGIQHESDDSASLGYHHLHRAVDLTYKAGALGNDLSALLSTPLPRPFFISAGFIEPHRRFPKDVDAGDAPEAPWLPEHPITRQQMMGFASLVQRMDRAVGQVLDALDASGNAENTVVVFSTDHGIDMPRAKGTLYDPGLESALLVRWPGRVTAGSQCHALVSTMDLFSTLAEIAEVRTLPADLHSRSLCPVLFGAQQTHREYVIAEKWHHCCYDPMRAIRTARYKLIDNFSALRPIEIPSELDMDVITAAPHLYRQRRGAIEIYDLQDDPWEQQNLTGRPELREAEQSLMAQLRQSMADTADPLLGWRFPLPNGRS